MKKILTLVACLSLVASLAIGGSIAYLTATTETVTNTFTIGNVKIDINENGFKDTALNPGITVDKKVQIDNTGATDAWVWMTIDFSPAALKDYVTLTFNNQDAWDTTTAASANAHLYKTPVTAGGNTGIYLESVSLASNIDIDGENLVKWENNQKTTIGKVADLKEIKIAIKAYAIQKDGFADVVKAYNAYQGQTGGTQVEEPAPIVGDDDNMTYEIPEGLRRVTNSDELKTAINEGETSILLADGEYTWTGTSKQGSDTLYNLNLYGESKNAVLCMTLEGAEGADYDFDGYNVTFTGLTISSKNYVSTGNHYPGWARMSAVYNDCVIDQKYVLYAGNQEFNYCTLNISGNEYNIWTWGAQNAKFDHCTFNSDGKAILLYGTASTNLTLNSCLFNDKGGLDSKKAAVEVGSGYNTTKSLTVTNTVVNGYEINDEGINTGSTLWGNKNSMTQSELNVVVDGVDVY